ncbi:hypothetical protein RLEG3_27105 [Rhizobium leguminosarum bv. trifolii WSM1689]|nr:hypothetical protein RLEG3_27105 [Rhizobium leguminosarum bv. trifolii WSM1689]
MNLSSFERSLFQNGLAKEYTGFFTAFYNQMESTIHISL